MTQELSKKCSSVTPLLYYAIYKCMPIIKIMRKKRVRKGNTSGLFVIERFIVPWLRKDWLTAINTIMINTDDHFYVFYVC